MSPLITGFTAAPERTLISAALRTPLAVATSSKYDATDATNTAMVLADNSLIISTPN
jgi:hypothetical protein